MNLDNRDYRSRKMKTYEQKKRMLLRDFRKMGETQMVVAALIMTITFAARFTIPGEYTKKDDMSILSRKMAFRVFVISDTLALIISGCTVIFYLASVLSRLKSARWYFAATISTGHHGNRHLPFTISRPLSHNSILRQRLQLVIFIIFLCKYYY